MWFEDHNTTTWPESGSKYTTKILYENKIPLQ